MTRRSLLGALICGLMVNPLSAAPEKKLSKVWRKLPDGWELIRMKHLNTGDVIKIDTVPGEFVVADQPIKLPSGVWSVNVELPNESTGN